MAQGRQAHGQACCKNVWVNTPGKLLLQNAWVYEACFRKPEQRDRAKPVTQKQIRQAQERLISRHDPSPRG